MDMSSDELLEIIGKFEEDQEVLFESLLEVQEDFQDRLCRLERLVCLFAKVILERG